jgi:hypothetical protein
MRRSSAVDSAARSASVDCCAAEVVFETLSVRPRLDTRMIREIDDKMITDMRLDPFVFVFISCEELVNNHGPMAVWHLGL